MNATNSSKLNAKKETKGMKEVKKTKEISTTSSKSQQVLNEGRIQSDKNESNGEKAMNAANNNTDNNNDNYSTYLGEKGYSIFKECLSVEEQHYIRNELIMKPFIPKSPIQPTPFPIYLESPLKLYMPRYFGIDTYGEPDRILIQSGNNISLSFEGELRPYQTAIVDKYIKHVGKCGGGLLDVAHSLADEFLSGDKLIVYSEGRSQPRTDLKASKKGLFEEGKLIMLTDEYSASASEILSGAIQDWDRGLIVGRRTFGKGLVQRPMSLSDGSEIRLTIARYYTPTGRFIQKPYDDPERYKKDLTQRFLNGEFANADSIKMPDSLLFKTLITKRTVYGGGGIMPDFFVPLDTTQSSEYYRKLIRGGHINNFSYRYVSSKKIELKKYYPTFTLFDKNFECNKDFMDEFFAYVQKEDPTLIFDEKDYNISKANITLRLKSIIAQDLWGVSELYQVYNDSNEIVQRALKIIRSKEYNSIKLD